MAKLIVKIKYMKPGRSRNLGKYARYIATREGVQKIDESSKYHEATTAQKEMIQKLLKDFPDSKETLEYEDYLKTHTIGKASEFISRVIEENFEGELDKKTYADYIATRPRAERIGRHGLFTDDGLEVDLKKVSQELNEFQGTIWTAIISLRREDAKRLGFDSGERWRSLVRAHTDEIAKDFGMNLSDLKWYGAYHDESYHPHIHLIIYDKSNRAYLGKKGIEALKSTFAHAIFKDEMYSIQNEKSDIRDRLRLNGKDEINEIISRFEAGALADKKLELMLVDLASRVRRHKGRLAYGYFSKDDKKLVDSIVDEIGKISAVAECYKLWYEKQEELSRYYKSQMPKRLALSANPEFKSLRNAVLKAAYEIDIPETEDLANKIASEEERNYQEKRQHQIRNLQHHYPEPMGVGLVITRLCNNVSRIFKEQFKDNPESTQKVDRKLRSKILERDQAHGIKH